MSSPVAIPKIYEPSPWQQEFHDLRQTEALGAGSAGPGKSLGLLMDCNRRIVGEDQRTRLDRGHPLWLPPGGSTGWALHLRRTYQMLKQSLDRAYRIFGAMDPGVRWYAQGTADKTLAVFSSGYKYEFGHCAKPHDWEKYESNQYDWIGFDELTQFLKEQYDHIKLRCRSSDPVLRGMTYIRCVSTPMMRREDEDFLIKDPFWVRKHFVDPAPEGRREIRKLLTRKDGERVWQTRIYLPATLYDNPDKEFVKDYELKLLDAPNHIRAAMLHGDWYVVADAYFGQWWNPRLHVCDPFRIPKEWPVFRALDWGFKSFGACLWFAQDPDGTLWVIHELTFKLKRPREVAKMILDVEEQLGRKPRDGRSLLTGVADNQLWEDKGDSGISKAEEFERAGVTWLKANKTRRRRNALLVVSRLKDHDRGMRRPGIVFFANCKRTIETLPAVGTDPNDSENPADGGEDHWVDACLYGCEYASRERAAPSEDDDEDEFEDETEAQSDGASWGLYG